MLLARHPAVEKRLHEELDAVVGTRPPTIDDLPELTYTDTVLREALRLYPPAWLIGRRALVDASESRSLSWRRSCSWPRLPSGGGFRLDPDQLIDVLPRITLRPRYGMRMRLEARR